MEIIDKLKLVYESELGRFYYSDFFEFTEKLEKEGRLSEYQVDHIITDPPYLHTSKTGSIEKKEVRTEFINLTKQSINTTYDNFEFDFEKFINYCYKYLKPGGNFLCFCNILHFVEIVRILDKCGFQYLYSLYFFNANAKVATPYFNNVEICIVSVKRINKKHRCTLESEPYFNKIKQRNLFPYYISNAVLVNRIPSSNNTVKCNEWLSDLIEIYTKEGDIIMDPCGGSGSLYLNAINLKRKFLGFEKVHKFAEEIIEKLQMKFKINIKKNDIDINLYELEIDNIKKFWGLMHNNVKISDIGGNKLSNYISWLLTFLPNISVKSLKKMLNVYSKIKNNKSIKNLVKLNLKLGLEYLIDKEITNNEIKKIKITGQIPNKLINTKEN